MAENKDKVIEELLEMMADMAQNVSHFNRREWVYKVKDQFKKHDVNYGNLFGDR